MSKFKYFVLCAVLIGATSCRRKKTTIVEPKETVYVEGPEKVVEVAKARDFEGAFALENNGFIELIESADGDVTIIRQYQDLITVNPKNGTFANLPLISGENFEVNNGQIRISRDVDYKDGSRYDVEEDVSGANITGRRKTVYTFSVEDGILTLRVQIYANKSSHNINFIVADREIRSL